MCCPPRVVAAPADPPSPPTEEVASCACRRSEVHQRAKADDLPQKQYAPRPLRWPGRRGKEPGKSRCWSRVDETNPILRAGDKVTSIQIGPDRLRALRRARRQAPRDGESGFVAREIDGAHVEAQ